jgi:choline dehydrogenase
MSHDDDWTDMRACVRLTREIFAQAAFKRFYSREISPGAGITSHADIDAFVKEKMQNGYHPCGTCRMGATSDPLAVVDPQARVIGVDALRVIDASIMPSITNGNLNAPTIMIAEKAADFVRGRPPLAPVDIGWYESDVWRESQR